MHESKGQHIGKAPSLHLFHTTASLRAESAPIYVVINAVHKYLSFTHRFTMTRNLQSTQAQGLGWVYSHFAYSQIAYSQIAYSHFAY